MVNVLFVLIVNSNSITYLYTITIYFNRLNKTFQFKIINYVFYRAKLSCFIVLWEFCAVGVFDVSTFWLNFTLRYFELWIEVKLVTD